MEIIENKNKCIGAKASDTNGKLPVSDMSQAFWDSAVSSAAKTVSGSNDEQRDQLIEKLLVNLQPYDWDLLICALETWGGGYRSGWSYRIPSSKFKESSKKDGDHFYEAWVI
jgi:hypothetical protein